MVQHKQKLTCGVDLGGTKIAIGLVDESGNVLYQELIKTRVDDGPQAIVGDIAASINHLRSQVTSGDVVAVGIGMAGQIDKATGAVFFAPNLGWHDFPLGAQVSQALKLDVFVTNDVRAATWGEWLYGAGRGCNDLLCLFVGTGIGSGVVSGGKMLMGESNAAGEVGHMTLDLHGPLCTCGNQGCFEALAGGWAITKRAKEAVLADMVAGGPLLALAGGKVEGLNAGHLFEAYRQGVPLAQKIVDEVKLALIAGVASLANAFNPARIILGGGVIQRNPELIEIIRLGVPSRALKAVSAKLQIVEAELKNDAGLIGAAAFAMHSYHEKGQ